MKEKVKNMEIGQLIEIIKGVQNPYPADIFSHTSEEQKDITIGRFNSFVHDVVEITRERIIEAIEESQ